MFLSAVSRVLLTIGPCGGKLGGLTGKAGNACAREFEDKRVVYWFSVSGCSDAGCAPAPGLSRM